MVGRSANCCDSSKSQLCRILNTILSKAVSRIWRGLTRRSMKSIAAANFCDCWDLEKRSITSPTAGEWFSWFSGSAGSAWEPTDRRLRLREPRGGASPRQTLITREKALSQPVGPTSSQRESDNRKGAKREKSTAQFQ